jgi:lipoic acid synthetase
LRVRWLGRLPYAEAWDLQRALWDGRVSGRSADDYLLLQEHPHTYTLGRFGDDSNLLIDEAALADIGAELFRVDRGGDITYHGPGQVVGYPIVHLGTKPDLVGHVDRMQRALVATLAGFGIESWAEDGFTGVWTAAGKIAAIGVRASKQVTMHGFALNVDPDLSYFGRINPCGLTRPVTSIAELATRPVSMEEVVRALIPELAAVFGDPEPEVQLGAFARGTGGGDFDIDRLVASGAFSPERRHEEPLLVGGRLAGEPERPEWMRVKADLGPEYRSLKKLMRSKSLNTVCEEAGCPNIYECWASGTATLMLLGEVCTRACAFCDVATGRPGEVDWDEPGRAAEAVAAMGLQHAVLTSVNRDDLSDGGAGVFVATIDEIRSRTPATEVEVLIPDFKGDPTALETVMAAKPDVLNHNTETVLRLQRDIRTAANYGRSLVLLARARWLNPTGTVKSGLIVGMGETDHEVLGALADLRAVGVDIVTIGQYLRPTARHRPIDRFVPPETFAAYGEAGRVLGIPHVESGPLVRSSYHAKAAKAAAG